jgi:Zn-dependent protease
VLTGFFGILLTQMVFLNVLLFVFNLLPLFPIDGWYIVLALLPADLATVWQRHQQTSQFVFIGLLLLSFVNLPGFPDIFSLLIGEPTFTITRFLLGF